jgi:hypothetical protein
MGFRKLAAARLICWFYGPILETINDINQYEEPKKPLRMWTKMECYGWFKIRHLDISGNKEDLKSRIIYYMKQHNGVPPIPEPPGGSASTIKNVIESLFVMISRLMFKTATHALISDTEWHIKIFLTYYEDIDKASRTSSEVPGWITSYNFCLLLNLPSIMREFGPLRN